MRPEMPSAREVDHLRRVDPLDPPKPRITGLLLTILLLAAVGLAYRAMAPKTAAGVMTAQMYDFGAQDPSEDHLGR